MAKLFVLPFFLFSLYALSSLALASPNSEEDYFLGSQSTEFFSTTERKIEISLKFNKKEFNPVYNHFEVKCSDLKTDRIKKLSLFYVPAPTTVKIEGDRFILKSTKKGKSYFLNLKTCSLEKVSYNDL